MDDGDKILDPVIGVNLADDSDNYKYFFVETFDLENFRPPKLSLTLSQQWCLGVTIFLAMVIGTYFKSILYTCIFESSRKPINILILTYSIICHGAQILGSLNYLLSIIYDDTIGTIVGRWYCGFWYRLLSFEICYMAAGNLGMALYRVLYIKHDQWVRYFVGEKLLLYIILVGGLAVTALMVTVQFNFEHRLKVVTDLCRAPSAIELRILTEYRISRGIEFATTSPFKFAIITMVLSMTIAQILCYVAIASYIYNHDNSATTRRILSAGVIRERNRTNAITLFGQLCTFLLQMVMYGIIFVIKASTNWRPQIVAAIIPIKIGFFAIISLVEIITSPSLKKRLPSLY